MKRVVFVFYWSKLIVLISRANMLEGMWIMTDETSDGCQEEL